MKKILMLLPLLAFLAGCNKSDESMSTPPATTNSAATNGAAPAH